MLTRGEHYKAIFGPWWAVVNGLWALLSSADTLVAKYGSVEFKKTWDEAWITPKWGWKIWAIGLLASTVLFALEYSFRHTRRILDQAHNGRKAEVKKVEDELAVANAKINKLETMPDISGEILVAFWEVRRDLDGMPWSKHSRYYIKLRLVNHNDVPCTINKYSLSIANYGDDKRTKGEGTPSSVGKLSHPTYTYIDENAEIIETDGCSEVRTRIGPINITTQWPLARGRKQEGWVTFDVWNYVPEPIKRIGEINPSASLAPWKQVMSVCVVDSLGNVHKAEDDLVEIATARFERS
ncbi:MAG TPA: hypothetical protein VN950_11580 [Terriglobales bacterium]|nr:hypothetical protein [Terriglobales bacterium]